MSWLPWMMHRFLMEQHALKNVNNCLNTNIYSYVETSGGKIYNLYLNVLHFFNTSVNKTCLHWCLICSVPQISLIRLSFKDIAVSGGHEVLVEVAQTGIF